MRLLIVEDDKQLNSSMKRQLLAQGYEVDCCDTGEEGLYFGLQNSYDLMILDRMLPEIDGITIVKTLRSRKITTPIILVTALNGLTDKITGLDSGADDYLPKPFAMEELFARIRALLRRPVSFEAEETFTYCDLKFSPASRSLSTPFAHCELSKREAALLELFLRNKNQVLTRELILSRVWGTEKEVTDGNIDNYISLLRRRLRTVKSQTKIITVHGLGYRIEEDSYVS